MSPKILRVCLVLVAAVGLLSCIGASMDYVGKACDASRPCPESFVCLQPDPGMAGSCAKTSCDAASDCVSGFVCQSRRCVQVCELGSECAGGAGCCRDGLCETCDGAPQLTKVYGNGSASCPDAVLGRCFADGLIIEGAGLADATFRLEGSGSFALATVAGSTASRVSVLLPASLTPGTYELVAVNAAGSDQTTVNILQGEEGPAGAGGVAIVAVGGVRANERHIYVDGIDRVTSTAAGTFVVLLDPATGAVTHAANYTDGASLATTLANAPADTILALATGADFLAPLTDEGAPDELIKYGCSLFMANSSIGFATSLGSAYALIGQKGLWDGNGFDRLRQYAPAVYGDATVATQLLTGDAAGAGVLAGNGRGITNQMRAAFLRRDGDTVNGNLDVVGNLTVSGYPVFRDYGVASGSCMSCNAVDAVCPAGMSAIAGGCELRGVVNGAMLLSSYLLDNGLHNTWRCFYNTSAVDTQYVATATCARVN